MRTIRGFFSDISTKTTIFNISGEYYNYFKNVLRLKKSDLIELFNNNDSLQYKTKIIAIDNKNITLEVINKKHISNENNYITNLYQAIIKTENFELVIQKATELGVNNIYPIITEFTNHKFDKNGFDKKLERWHKIAIAGSEQCGRVFIPKIHTPIDINDLQMPQNDLNLVLCPYTQAKQDFVQKVKSSANFNIFIGPEGGFSDKEMSKFHSNNFYTINLGKRILKAETAPINILSIINFIKQ
ncbi:16S rRNA (uracil(1498)-N(3))-methyltransferase [Francisella tularensis]|uniref:16S rRNA (uracil(1498)-N(3))-methyltransferase n=1 Tax=Francisella tularensis TaxID=263 RepID=UPI001C0F2CD7|nr:16S rRNA (uracil(1498)-N(3))-methyltransferase [Francisella tularensis]MBK2109732.1 16S rRNA (uracil(1498)-N(3))-methyltransferase [Francisella tularensis subsp. novicida FSC595]